MVRPVLLSAGLVFGVALVIRSVVPRRLTAAEAVAVLSGTMPSHRGLVAELLAYGLDALLLVRPVQGWLVPVEPDLAVMRLTAESFVGGLLKKTALVTVGFLAWGTGLLLPTPVSAPVMVGFALVVVATIWVRDVTKLQRSARDRRRTMTNVVQGLLTIVMVGATTATPINEVAERALDHGHGWAYDLLRDTFRQGTASNLKIYESLGELAKQIESRSLHLFADSIRAGDHEALALRSVAQRSHTLQAELATNVVARAEEHRRTLQLPIAAFAITVVVITVVVPLMAGL